MSACYGKALTGDEEGLDGLSDADVVGDQEPDGVHLQGHEERHELVRPRLDGDLAERSERAGTRAETEPDRVPQEAAGQMIAQLSRLGRGEVRGPDLFEVRIDPGDLHVRAAERPHDEEVFPRLRE